MSDGSPSASPCTTRYAFVSDSSGARRASACASRLRHHAVSSEAECIAIEETERDLGLRTVERDAEWAVGAIGDDDGAGGSGGWIDQIAAIDPGVAGGPSVGASSGDGGAERGARCECGRGHHDDGKANGAA